MVRIVEPGGLMAAAREVADRAARLAPLAVAGMKEMVREAPGSERIEALIRECAFSDDVREGLSALREKRPPAFRRR